jgi:hypothetical protein
MTYKLSFIGFGDNLELLWAIDSRAEIFFVRLGPFELKIWLLLDEECEKMDPRRSVDPPVVSNMGGSYR